MTGFPSTSSCYFIVFLFILDLARCILVSVKIMDSFVFISIVLSVVNHSGGPRGFFRLGLC